MIVPAEKIYKRFENKYRAVNVVAMTARKLKDEQTKGLIEERVNPVFEALRKVIAGKVRFTE